VDKQRAEGLVSAAVRGRKGPAIQCKALQPCSICYGDSRPLGRDLRNGDQARLLKGQRGKTGL